MLLNIFICCVGLLLSNSATSQPIEEGDFKAPDLVELIDLDTTLQLDIRYATSNNFVGKPVYDTARAFLQREAAMALLEVSKELRSLGYGLVVYDGYRPWSVTKLFWDITPEDQRAFVADPKYGSRHNRGCAVDLSLYDLATGEPVEMPSDYDTFDESAHPDFKGGTKEQRKMRDLLRAKMEAHGFMVYENEWWHFDYQGWEAFRLLDVPFDEID